MNVRLAIACQEIEAQVRLTTEHGLTYLEEAMVGALLCGHETAEDLGAFLGVGERLAVDVLHGLWSRGHVTVDFTSGRVAVTPEARAIQLDEARRLQSGTVQVAPRTFLHEPISGAVLRRNAARSIPDDAVVVPRDLVSSPDDVPRDQLVRLLQQELDELETGVRPLASRVLEVSLGPQSQRRAGKDRRVLVEAAIQIDAAGRVRVQLLECPFGDRATRLLEGHIEARCDSNPHEQFAQALRSRADREFDPPDAARRRVEAVRAHLALVREASDADYDGLVRDLIAADRSAAAGIAQARRNSATLTPVLGVDALEAVATELIDAAVHQVVIAAPQPAYRSMNRLFAAIERALKRRVRVVVSWGDRLGAPFDPQLGGLRADLLRAHGDQLVWSTRSGPLSARALVCDGREMLVGSSPAEMLGGTDERAIAVRVSTAAGQPSAPDAVADILVLIRNTFPDVDLASAIAVDFDVEPGPADPGAAVVAKLYESTRGAAEPQRSAYLDVWVEHLEGREGALEACERAPSVTVHRGAASRSALIDLLRRSEGPAIVQSRRVHVAAIDSDLLAALDLASEAGTVHLGSRDLDDDDGRFSSLVNWKAADTKVDASILVTTQNVLLTTFDLLSDIPARWTDDLGVVLADGALARVLFQHLEDIYVPAPETPGDDQDRRGDGLVGPLLELASAVTDRERIDIIDRAVEGADDPLMLVDRWEETQQPAVVRRAAVVAIRAATDPEAIGRRADWLIADALRRERYVEAAAIADALAPHGSILPEALLACCPLEGAWLGAAAVDLALQFEPTVPYEAAAAVAGMATELLFGPVTSSDANEALRVVVGHASDAWARVGTAVAEYSIACQRPLPVDYLRDRLSIATAAAEASEEWDGLSRTIDGIRQRRRRWTFDTGLAVHDYLFDPEGPLSLIDEAALGGAAERSALASRLPDDVHAAIDRALHTRGVEPMAWAKHNAYLRGVERAVESARRLSESHTSEATSLPSDAVLWAMTSLAETLRAEAGALTIEVEADSDGLAVARRRFVRSLAPVLAWNGEVSR